MFVSKQSGRRRGPRGTIKDPLRARLKPVPEPSDEALVKHDTGSSDLAAGGTPGAGRTTLDEARRKGLVGWLQVLGPGLITGASDDDPSGIGTYAPIFKIFKWLTLALFAYVLTAFFAHPQPLAVIKATLIPHLELSRDFVMALVAVLGTTISPYLFFWQASSEVDELKAAGATTPLTGRRGLRVKELQAARLDIFIGMAFSNLVMYFIILTSAAVLHAHGKTNIETASQAAAALAPLAGPFAFVLFAAGMIGSGLLGIPILAASASYALKEFLGLRGDLASKPRYRPTFYIMLAAATGAGVVMNFMHLDPIRALFVTAVINGIVAPPLLILIILLGADRRIMNRYRSGRLSLVLTGTAAGLMAVAAVALLGTTVAGA